MVHVVGDEAPVMDWSENHKENDMNANSTTTAESSDSDISDFEIDDQRNQVESDEVKIQKSFYFVSIL